MIDIRVQVVYPDGIDAQDLHQGGIAHAHGTIAQWILSEIWIIPRGAARLIGNTDDLELIARVGVYEGVSPDLERRKGRSERCAQPEGQKRGFGL